MIRADAPDEMSAFLKTAQTVAEQRRVRASQEAAAAATPPRWSAPAEGIASVLVAYLEDQVKQAA